MKRKHFSEFLEAKDGLANKKGSIPNQDIPKATNPEKIDVSKGLAAKDYKGKLSIKPKDQKALPYKALGKEKTGFVFAVPGEDPLGNKGMPGMSAKDAMGDEGKKPDGVVKPVKSHKMTSEEFINATKGLSPDKFLEYFASEDNGPIPTITDLYGNQFTPDPTQTIQYLSALITKNPKLMSRLVREVKRQSGLGGLIGELGDHPESYQVFVEGLAHPEEGKKRCHRVAKAMNDNYTSMLDKFMHESVVPKPDAPDDEGGPFLKNAPSSPIGDPQSDDIPAEPQGGAFGGGGIDNTQIDTSGQNNPMGGGMPSQFPGPKGGQAPDFGNGAPNMQKFPKLKSEGMAHHNLITEIGGFPSLFDTMHQYCTNCKK